ncbi:MAG: putative PEP-binding protein, partial [Tepidanaerobacteraceae bacterium]
TGMCGEMAGDTWATAILLGMGLDEFSMSAGSIPQVKNIIRSLSFEKAKQIAEKALSMDDPEDIRNMVKEEMDKIIN